MPRPSVGGRIIRQITPKCLNIFKRFVNSCLLGSNAAVFVAAECFFWLITCRASLSKIQSAAEMFNNKLMKLIKFILPHKYSA